MVEKKKKVAKPKKETKKEVKKEEAPAEDLGKELGKVTHFYDKISVAIIELSDKVAKGDTIHLKGHTTDFEQPVDSIEIEHKSVDEAKKGDVIGVKVSGKCREGDRVYRK